MYEAEVGDDVWGEDPTVKRLEARAAELMGKEAAVFVASGTQGNLVGVLSHTERGDEVILGERSHIFRYEVGGVAVVGGIQTRTIPNGKSGALDPTDVRNAIRGGDIHEPRTGLVALENTHNACGGGALTEGQMTAVADVAHTAGVPVHLDGARIFNAATALGIPPSRLTRPVDSVTFCLSKGLGAPVGSLLCGSSDYIARARKWRKLLGGGMRQVGVIAAAGFVALDENVDRLAEDQANARKLAEGAAAIPGIDVDLPGVQSNIVMMEIGQLGMEPAVFLNRLAAEGVRLSQAGAKRLRAVVSYEVDASDIDYALQVMASVANQAVPALA